MMKRAVPAIAMILAGVARAAGPVPLYTADAGASRLEFTGNQAGAEFKGTFRKFTAAIGFAPDALAGSRFDVQIELNSADTLDQDRDTTLRGSDFFDVVHYPQAHYVARSFAKTATGYSAQGALTLHGVTQDVPVDFSFTSTAAGAKLEGTAHLKRLQFGVGRGDWRSTEWVKDEVKVSFSLVLKSGS